MLRLRSSIRTFRPFSVSSFAAQPPDSRANNNGVVVIICHGSLTWVDIVSDVAEASRRNEATGSGRGRRELLLPLKTGVADRAADRCIVQLLLVSDLMPARHTAVW